MKRTATAAAIAAALLLLAGCSAGTQENVAVTSATSTPAAPAESAAPLTAQTPEATTQGGEAAFLEEVRADLRADNVIPDATDEQLLAAGEEACERLAAGEAGDTISVIDGEQKDSGGYYRDSGQIVTAAAMTIC